MPAAGTSPNGNGGTRASGTAGEGGFVPTAGGATIGGGTNPTAGGGSADTSSVGGCVIQPGKALLFDSLSHAQYVSNPDNEKLHLNAITIEAWVFFRSPVAVRHSGFYPTGGDGSGDRSECLRPLAGRGNPIRPTAISNELPGHQRPCSFARRSGISMCPGSVSCSSRSTSTCLAVGDHRC